MFRDREAAVAGVAPTRYRADQSRPRDAGKRPHALEQRLIETRTLRRLAVFRLGKAESHGEHAVRRAAEINKSKARVTPQQQTGPHQQHNGEAHFQRQQPFS